MLLSSRDSIAAFSPGKMSSGSFATTSNHCRHGSFVHSIDPGAKLIAFALLAASILVAGSFWSLLFVALFLGAIILAARVPFASNMQYLRRLE